MRTLGDHDAFLPTDLGIRRAVEELGAVVPGYSIEMKPESLDEFEFPTGNSWTRIASDSSVR